MLYLGDPQGNRAQNENKLIYPDFSGYHVLGQTPEILDPTLPLTKLRAFT